MCSTMLRLLVLCALLSAAIGGSLHHRMYARMLRLAALCVAGIALQCVGVCLNDLELCLECMKGSTKHNITT